MRVLKPLRDIHSERDTRRLSLDRAGVKGLRYASSTASAASSTPSPRSTSASPSRTAAAART